MSDETQNRVSQGLAVGVVAAQVVGMRLCFESVMEDEDEKKAQSIGRKMDVGKERREERR